MASHDTAPSSIGIAGIYDRAHFELQAASRVGMSGVFTLVQGSSTYWLKSSAEQIFTGRSGLEQYMGPRRSKATFLVDEALGLCITPKTYLVHSMHNGFPVEISVQEDAAGVHADFKNLPRDEIVKLAILDYVTCQLDRHPENILWSPIGRIAAIDNDLSFSVSPEEIIQSDAVEMLKGVPLSEDLVARMKKTDVIALHRNLKSLLGSDVANAAIERLKEIIDNGKILGTAWPGRIDSHFTSSIKFNNLGSLGKQPSVAIKEKFSARPQIATLNTQSGIQDPRRDAMGRT